VEAVKTNVLGTRIVRRRPRNSEWSGFVLVSTDKAVRPTNVMGATKRLAELVIHNISNRQGRRCSSPSGFGNVLAAWGA